MTRRPSFLARLVLAGLLVAGQAAAQQPPPAVPPAAPPAAPPVKPPPPTLLELQEAGRQSEVANRLFTLGVYETAVTHFQKAYDLAHKPADLQKVAECDKALGLTGAAFDAYTKLLALHGPALGFAGAVAAKKAIAELGTATGTLDVHSTPDGATVRVGERVLGVTPFSAPVRLPVGALHVEVSKDGFEPSVINVAIDAAHPGSIDTTLQPRVMTGHLSVKESHAATAHLMVDGNDVGPLPWEGDVAPGVHQLEIQATDLKAEPQTVKVARGAKAEATFNADFTAGQLKIAVHPDGADIALDGKSIGKGTFDGQVAVGDHTLKITLASYKAVEKPITVVAQSTVSAEFTLEHQVTDAELAAEQAAKDAEAIRGFYGQLAVFGAWPPVSTHLDCNETANPDSSQVSESCTTGFVYSGGGAVRVGYSWGIFGLELVGGFMYSRWEDDATYTSNTTNMTNPMTPGLGEYQHTEAYTFTSMAGLGGLGPRLTTAGRTFRLTLGAAGGVVYRQIQMDRSMSNGVSESPSLSLSTSVISPAAIGDIGFIVGSTPGVNFIFGGMAWAEFPSTTQVNGQTTNETANGTSFTVSNPGAGSGPFTVQNGPQVFIGPYVGIRFGH